MAGSEVFAGLSGVGVQDVSFAFGATRAYFAVTNAGVAHPIDPLEPARWIDVGWVAFYSHFVSHPSGLPDGYYLHHVTFIDSLHFQMNGDPAFDDSGIDGFVYTLRPGVILSAMLVYP